MEAIYVLMHRFWGTPVGRDWWNKRGVGGSREAL